MSDDLVERVARALMRAEPWSSFWGKADAEKLATAAIAVVLEEAARVAEAFPARTHGNLASAPYAAAEQAGDEIAAAIRAMIPQEQNND